METKTSHVKLESVQCKLSFDSYFSVNSIGRSGGLAMLWSENTYLEVLNYLNHHIHARIQEGGSENTQFINGFYSTPITITGFYSTPITNNWEASWSLLTSLIPSADP